jgi:23S rRNA pseudouridine2604 synthase
LIRYSLYITVIARNMEKEEKSEVFPMRINKYLALKNIASRREADELIRLGRIKINGKRASLGDKVFETDKVEVSGKNLKKLVYYAYNKPVGIITHSPQGEEKSIADITSFKENVFPVGRLDKNSWGLIILTNDGRVTDKILSPERNHEKEYSVTVERKISESFLRKMGEGVKLDDGYRTKKAKILKINDHLFSIILTEGKKRQIRRMCTALGFSVRDLKRVRILNIGLRKLKPGEFREVKGEELREFLQKIGL